jgi:hypothetical protein
MVMGKCGTGDFFMSFGINLKILYLESPLNWMLDFNEKESDKE